MRHQTSDYSAAFLPGFFRVAFAIAVLLSVAPAAGEVEKIVLLSVPDVAAPVIENKVLRLTVDLVFDKCPQEYWLHHSKDNKQLVIEFFGVHVDVADPEIRGTKVVSDLTVSNTETDLALNKRESRVVMKLEENWHYESWIIGGKVLRLQLWMPLDPKKVINKKKKTLTMPLVLVTVVVAAVTCAVALVAAGEKSP